MAYNGSVTLISGLKQANNQNFPLVDAPAVRVTDSKRLNESLDDLENNKATKENPVFTGSISLGRPSSSPVGANSLAIGTDVVASGNSSHAEGYRTQATFQYAHAEGEETQATQPGAHAEGDHTIAEGTYSHAEGQLTVAHGSNSHTEGDRTYAEGANAHAEGESTYAEGWNSHTEGSNTYAKNRNQHVFGEYNVSDPSTNNAGQRGTYIEIVGNGIATSSKANARALDWQGNEYLKGDLYVGCNSDSTGGNKVATVVDVADKAEIDNAIFTGSISMDRTGDIGNKSVAVGVSVEASGEGSHAEGYETTASNYGAHSEGTLTVASGNSSHAEGIRTTASHTAQHVFGINNVIDSDFTDLGTYIEIVGNGDPNSPGIKSNARALEWNGNERLKGDLYIQCNEDSTGGYKVAINDDVILKANKDNAVFTSSISLGRKENTTIGVNSVAVGYNGTASGMYSHAEGDECSATGNFSHAEGFITVASGGSSHSEGDKTTASAGNAHAEGFMTTASAIAAHAEGGHTEASGLYSHAEGTYTIANQNYQHVFGAYNISDVSVEGTYVEIVGNGTSEGRSNARALDWQGNEYLMGDLYVGCDKYSRFGNKVLVSSDLSSLEDEIDTKADKTNTKIINNITFDAAQNNATGRNSAVFGEVSSATGNGSVALGTMTLAKGNYSLANGTRSKALGSSSHAEGEETIAVASQSYASGHGTIASWSWQHVIGEYNVPDKLQYASEWQSYHQYTVGYSIYRTVNEERKYYVCIEDHSSGSTFNSQYWAETNTYTPYTYYVEIVGTGNSNDDRENGRTLDKAGNERLHGDLYVKCNKDSSGGVKVAKVTDVYAIDNILTLKQNPNIAYNLIENTYVLASNGLVGSISGSATTDFIRIDMFSEISFKNKKVTSESTTAGWAFYNENQEKISSGSNISGAAEAGYEDLVLTVPDTAAYFRTTIYPDETYGEFEIHGTKTKLQLKFEDLNVKANKQDPIFNGTVSRGRLGNSQIGTNSIALGDNVTASGWFSFAEGQGTIAGSHYQHASGKYNVADLNDTYAEIVGNGWAEMDDQTFNITEHRSNIRVLDWDGNERIAGDLYVGCNEDSTGGTKVAKISDIQDPVTLIDDLAWTELTNKTYSVRKITSTYALKTSPVFDGNSVSFGRKANTTVGVKSSAFGMDVEASGLWSFACGFQTVASGGSTFAEGYKTTASYEYSHAEGQETVASGWACHTEGVGTIAQGTAQHVSGKYNIADSYRYVEIVGNGSNATTRANARTLDWQGNESLAGSITLGKDTADEVTLTAAQLKQLLDLLT